MTTLAVQDQPHSIAVHVEFLRRTETGPVTYVVKDVKLGRQTSTIHITAVQHGREEVAAYVINSNLLKESGPSFSTGWELNPLPRPVDLKKLKAGGDENYAAVDSMPFPKFRKASLKLQFHLPRKSQFLKSMIDEWICFSTGERFTNECLGFVADMFPMIPETYRHGPDPHDVPSIEEQNSAGKRDGYSRFWYPTLTLNLDIKKALPKDGVEFLFVRVRTKQIRNGRYDLEVIILDEEGDMVALSHHVSMVLSAERNMAERKVQKESNL